MKIKPMLHMCINKAIKYKEQVPLSGPHRPQWPVYGEYTYIPAQRWLHALEHGAAVFLYNPCVNNQTEIDDFKSLARNCLRRHIIGAFRKLTNNYIFNVLTLGCKLEFNTIYGYETKIKQFIKVLFI